MTTKTSRSRRLAAFMGVCLAGAALLAACASTPVAEPTEAELRAEYTRFVGLRGDKEYRVRHVMLQTREQAQAALDEIRSGGNFAAVAKRLSVDPSSRDRGGDLGWMGVREVDEVFSSAMQALPAGSMVQAPVKTKFGWHLIRVDEIRPVRVPPYEELRPQILAALKEKRAAAAASSTAQLPDWTAEQWDLVFAAAQHTAGSRSFEYRSQVFPDEAAARRASEDRILLQPSKPLKVRHLIDVPPEFRFAFTRLLVKGDTSPPVVRTEASGQRSWTVVQLIASASAEPLRAGPQLKGDLARWVARGHLPGPEELAGSAAERARIAYFRARTVGEVNALPPGLDANVAFGNHSTPLLHAIFKNDLLLGQALARRGADVNHCGAWGCPLEVAAAIDNEKDALTWTRWLLDAGAKVDGQDPRGEPVLGSALSRASYAGHVEVAQLLLRRGASINGVGKASLRPVEAAAAKPNRAMVEWLIARGASVTPDLKRPGMMPTTLYTAALESQDKAFIEWIEKLMLDPVMRDPAYRVKLGFEQDGKLLSATGGKVRLRARPFKLVFQLPPGAHSVQVGASFQSAWADEVRRGDPRNAMRRPMTNAVLASVDKPDSDDLVVSDACPATARADEDCDGTFMTLNVNPRDRDDFHERSPKQGRYARKVGTILEPAPGYKSKAIKVQELAGRTLYLAFGQAFNLGGWQGMRLPQAQYVAVEFTN